MSNSSSNLALDNYYLKPGYIYVPAKSTVISTVVGSCVAVSVFDRRKKIGGMNHFQFPYIDDSRKATARYGNVSVSFLINMMIAEGSSPGHLEAHILGGAFHPKISHKNIGKDNIKVAQKILSRRGIRVVSEDVGGSMGRKVVFNTSNNELMVIKVDQLRHGDWYPYEGRDKV